MAESQVQNLLDGFQSCMYPKMYDALGEQLGVSADSLRRLAIGYAPIVEFKKGKNFQGWFAIPERDADAKVTGISLRSVDGNAKVMLKGTHHGLIYEVNPDHQAGEKGYSAGSHNWIRTMDAGVPCPVCGKPDGCLLSAENPTHPKAAVCIREKSDKPLRFGFLHILKPEGQLSGRAALPDNGGPVVVVEGMSDTAAAMDLGFVSVGRPSNLAGMEALCDLIRSRTVVILGENDRKEDGKEPGREGMVAVFQNIKRVCANVTMLMPPVHVKDLRAWKVKYGLIREGLLAAIERDGLKQLPNAVVVDSRPTTMARSFLAKEFSKDGSVLLRQWEQNWYVYTDGKYENRKEETIIKPIYDWAYDKLVQVAKPSGELTMEPMKMDPYQVKCMQQALMAEVLISATKLPCYINGKTGPNPHDLIVFKNGALDVMAFLAQKSKTQYWRDSTPDLFTLTALPYTFEPTATCDQWEVFLESSIGDDPMKILLLQEWIGYCLTSDTTMQKMMFFRGLSGSGKGTMIRVLHKLVGPGQAAATSFAGLAGEFGMAPLIGKMICTLADVRTPRKGGESHGLEILLNITGGDEVQINRKFKDHLESQQITARITMAGNSFIEITDYEGALMRRLNLIEFSRTFVDAPDRHLDAKLAKEVPGIIVWALAGLKRLRKQGHFTVPPSSIQALQEIRTDLSPLSSFIEECCERGGEVGKAELFGAWSRWSVERQIDPMSMSKFLGRMRSNAPYAASITAPMGGHKNSIFRGISLRAWAARQLLGKP